MIVMVTNLFLISEVYALDFSFESPGSVVEDEEFEVSISADTGDIFDVKIFVYQEEYSIGKLNYHVLDEKGEEVIIKQDFNTEVGENKYEMDLSAQGLLEGEQYVLIITDRKNRKLELKFKYGSDED